MKARLFIKYFTYSLIYFFILQVLNSISYVIKLRIPELNGLNLVVQTISILMYIGILIVIYKIIKNTKPAGLWASIKYVLKKRWVIYGLIIWFMSNMGENFIFSGNWFSSIFYDNEYREYVTVFYDFYSTLVSYLLSSVSALLFFVFVTFFCDVVSTARTAHLPGSTSDMRLDKPPCPFGLEKIQTYVCKEMDHTVRKVIYLTYHWLNHFEKDGEFPALSEARDIVEEANGLSRVASIMELDEMEGAAHKILGLDEDDFFKALDLIEYFGAYLRELTMGEDATSDDRKEEIAKILRKVYESIFDPLGAYQGETGNAPGIQEISENLKGAKGAAVFIHLKELYEYSS